jgi:hypothetical protein
MEVWAISYVYTHLCILRICATNCNDVGGAACLRGNRIGDARGF